MPFKVPRSYWDPASDFVPDMHHLKKYIAWLDSEIVLAELALAEMEKRDRMSTIKPEGKSNGDEDRT